jgi:hypothetical protein
LKKEAKNFCSQAVAWGAAVVTRVVPGHKVFLLLLVHKKKPSLLLKQPDTRVNGGKTHQGE